MIAKKKSSKTKSYWRGAGAPAGKKFRFEIGERVSQRELDSQRIEVNRSHFLLILQCHAGSERIRDAAAPPVEYKPFVSGG